MNELIQKQANVYKQNAEGEFLNEKEASETNQKSQAIMVEGWMGRGVIKRVGTRVL